MTEQTPEQRYLTSTSMRTFSGVVFDPLAMKPDDVRIEDIAHGLSNMCRFNGQCLRFYSVGEHSYLIAKIALEVGGPVAARYGLAHDAHEAYSGDMIRPLKRRDEMLEFRLVQDEQQKAIELALGIADTPQSVRDLVKRIDSDIVIDEGKVLFTPRPGSLTSQLHRRYPGLDIGTMSPAGAEAAFLAAWRQLNEVTP